MITAAWILCLLAPCVIGSSRLAQDGVVEIADGVISGNVRETYVEFLGIPFAAPPVGELRWTATQENAPWRPAVLNATAFRYGCPQNCNLPPHNCPTETSEDCLTLNIWTPRGSAGKALPVMVFLHGGHFEQGDAGSTLYNSSIMATTGNVVVVTANYRLGALGWLVSGPLSGNFAILDQRLMLRWVQANIAAFGGAPWRVTIFGQSAGAGCVAVHLTSPESAGLFAAAIIESNPWTLPMKSLDVARELGDIFVANVSCAVGDVACLRAASIQNILAAQNHSEKHLFPRHLLDLFLPWTAAVDGKVVAQNPIVAMAKGDWPKVPLMFGNVAEEAWLFINEASAKPVPEEDYLAVLAYIFEIHAPAVLERYPVEGSERNDTRPQLSTLGTDYMFVCPSRMIARAAAASGNPTYLYSFNHVMSFNAWGPNYEYCIGHVCHGSELPFVFHSVYPFFNFSSAEASLSDYMTALWTNFANTFSPNQGPQTVSPQWPLYSEASDELLLLEAPTSSVASKFRESYCDFFDKIGYAWGV